MYMRVLHRFHSVMVLIISPSSETLGDLEIFFNDGSGLLKLEVRCRLHLFSWNEAEQ